LRIAPAAGGVGRSGDRASSRPVQMGRRRLPQPSSDWKDWGTLGELRELRLVAETTVLRVQRSPAVGQLLYYGFP
jgi:hypothetical protein